MMNNYKYGPKNYTGVVRVLSAAVVESSADLFRDIFSFNPCSTLSLLTIGCV